MTTNALPAAPESSSSSQSSSIPPAASPGGRGGGPGPGRPSGFSPEMMEMLYAIVRAKGCSDSGAAAEAGLHPATISRWKRQHPELLLRLRAAREQWRGAQLDVILESAHSGQKGGWRAAAWLLERVFPEDYSPRARERALFREQQEAAWAREEEEVGELAPPEETEFGEEGSQNLHNSPQRQDAAATCGSGFQPLPSGEAAAVGSGAQVCADETASSRARALHNVHNSVVNPRVTRGAFHHHEGGGYAKCA